MAGTEEIARLAAVLEADIKKFESGMTKAQREFDKRAAAIEKRNSQLTSNVSAGFGRLGTMFTRFLTVAAFARFTRELVQNADQLEQTGKISTKTADGLRKLGSSVSVITNSLMALAAVPFAAIGEGLDKITNPKARVAEFGRQIEFLQKLLENAERSRSSPSLVASLQAQIASLQASQKIAIPAHGPLVLKPGATWDTSGGWKKAKKPETEDEMLKRLGLPDIGVVQFWEMMATNAIEKFHNAIGPAALSTSDLEKAFVSLEDVLKDAPEITESFSQALQDQIDLTDEFRNSVVELGLAALDGGDSFDQMASRVIRRLRDIFVEMAILEPLTRGLFGDRGTSGGGIFGGIINGISSAITGAFTGPHASGGMIPSGKWGTASENEAVYATARGAQIVPIGGRASPRGSGTTNLHWTIEVKGTTDKELIAQFRAGAATMLAQYDRALPGRVADLTADPHRR